MRVCCIQQDAMPDSEKNPTCQLDFIIEDVTRSAKHFIPEDRSFNLSTLQYQQSTTPSILQDQASRYADLNFRHALFVFPAIAGFTHIKQRSCPLSCLASVNACSSMILRGRIICSPSIYTDQSTLQHLNCLFKSVSVCCTEAYRSNRLCQ